MKEKKSIDNLSERLKEELLEEEARGMKLIEEDESLKDYHVTEEMDRRMEERLKRAKAERAAYEMLSEEDKEAIRIGREALALSGPNMEEKKEPVKKKKKVFLLVAIAAVMLFAFGMTGIGEVPFVRSLIKDDLGDREITKINTKRENEDNVFVGISKEEEFYQEVNEALGVEVVRMSYLPQGAEFLEGVIENDIKNVYMLFEYEDKTIEYQFVLNYNSQVYGHDVEDVILEETGVEVSGVEIVKRLYQLPDGTKQYVAEFLYDGTFYTINAPVSEEEIGDILRNLIFY